MNNNYARITMKNEFGFTIKESDISTGKIVLNGVEVTDTESWNKAIKTFSELEFKLKEKDKEIKRLEHNAKVSTKWELKLSQENQKLKEELQTTQEKWKKDKQWVECRTKEWLNYKSTIDKANEYIKEHTNNFAEYLDVYEAKELSNIIKGSDKE